MLRVEGVGKTLGGFVLRDVSFDVGEGEYFVLLGASGIGKTVLLETIAGILRPDTGRVVLDGRDITYQPIWKRSIGLVYQDQGLFPHLSVSQNIAYGLRHKKLGRAQVRQRVAEIAEDVGADHLLDRSPQTLSGGEAQRVALARALATRPRCVLLDEPLSSLDARARSAMRALLRKLHRRANTMVHVTHDYEEAMSLASRVAVMERGTITQAGSPEQVFRHPTSEFVARFIGIRNFFKGRLSRPDGGNGELAEFVTGGLAFSIATEGRSGPGCVIVRSEDVTLSNTRTETSARNTFLGTVVDIAPARLGVEVTVDLGVELMALVTRSSVERLDLRCGKKIWASFKATAARFIEQ